ncbi:MAG: HAD-IIIC family phosphatase [Acidobacteriaceae bacterium]
MAISNPRHARRELAQILAVYRPQLAEALFQATKEPDCAAGVLPASFDELDQWGQEHFLTAVDLAMEWFRTPAPQQEDLFAGWLSQLKAPAIRTEDMGSFLPGNVLRHSLPRWQSILQNKISSAAFRALAEELNRVIEVVSRPARRSLRVLFIGDCLLGQVMACLAGPCAAAGIAVDSVYLHNGIQAILRNEIRALNPSRFDIVFFSPFSYTFVPEYGQLIRWQAIFWSRPKLFAVLDQVLQEVSQTVRLLAERFNCPVYIHNSAVLTQTFNLWIGIGKNFLSWRNRTQVRPIICQRIGQILSDPAFAGNLRLVDEESLRLQTSDFSLGKVIYEGHLHHPSILSLQLAHGPYSQALATAAFLVSKKVVVCDLDNTLWHGVIGDGPVEHFIDRQTTLKQLRDRGILLSINSKNDPKNVHFSGATLQFDDFVAPRINWAPKPSNMSAIIRELNLKEKDFVFIDDRPDELERVQNAFPAMITLDARDPRVWQSLAHWASHLPSDQQEDRTRLYHERSAREMFLSHRTDTTVALEDETAASLNLCSPSESSMSAVPISSAPSS